MKKPQEPKEPPPARKKPYRPPKLIIYGNVKDLTGKHMSPGDSKGRQGIVG